MKKGLGTNCRPERKKVTPSLGKNAREKKTVGGGRQRGKRGTREEGSPNCRGEKRSELPRKKKRLPEKEKKKVTRKKNRSIEGI